MAKKQETKVQRATRQAIEDEYGKDCFWFKVHGGMFQTSGIPDLLGCIFGLYMAIELKYGKGSISGVQRTKLRLIRRAGGLAFVSRSPEHSLRKIRSYLINHGKITKDEAIQKAEAGLKLGKLRKRGRRLVHGAGDWRDRISLSKDVEK